MTAARRTANWFAIWVTAGVIALLVTTTALTLVINSAGAATATPVASNFEASTGALVQGDGPDRVDLYFDFLCVKCNAFEESFGEEISALVEHGRITLALHPIAGLDRMSQGTAYSTRAANALYCVADIDAEASVGFMRALYTEQRNAGSAGLSDSQLTRIAADQGVSGIDACINNQTYADYLGELARRIPRQPGESSIGTPTVAINGSTIHNRTLPEPGAFAELLN